MPASVPIIMPASVPIIMPASVPIIMPVSRRPPSVGAGVVPPPHAVSPTITPVASKVFFMST